MQKSSNKTKIKTTGDNISFVFDSISQSKLILFLSIGRNQREWVETNLSYNLRMISVLGFNFLIQLKKLKSSEVKPRFIT